MAPQSLPAPFLPDEAAASLPAAGGNAPVHVLALGDSLVAGHGLAPHEGFARRIEQGLQRDRPGSTVVNAGVSGNTTGDARRRLPAVLAGLRRRPDLALVGLGANDVLRGVPPAETRANLDAIVRDLAGADIAVLLMTVEPPPFLAAFAQAYAGTYADVAARHRLPTCSFFPEGVLGHPDMVLADRLHPNARAIELCAAAVLPALLSALAPSG